jgi:hypothetical protein
VRVEEVYQVALIVQKPTDPNGETHERDLRRLFGLVVTSLASLSACTVFPQNEAYGSARCGSAEDPRILGMGNL